MRWLPTIVCWVLCLCVPLVSDARVRPYDDIVASGVLKVAVYEHFAPYSFEENGKARGVDVDLAQALAEGLGLKLELLWIVPGEKLDDDLRNFIWKGHYLRPGVLADLMLRVPYDKDYRNQRNDVGELANEQVVMFAPYQRERWQVVHDTRRLPKVDSIGVFRLHRIGVELESVPSFYLSTVFGGQLSANTDHFPTTAAAFAALQGKKVDAVMGLRGELDWLMFNAKDAALKESDNTYPNLGQPTWDIGMAVHESNRQLSNAIDMQVEDMINDGRMAKLFEAYGVHYELPGLYQEVE
ncbi:ABC transporter substrate-binding protein [Pseudomonas sp. GV071]|jgi:ABC-type amino acid transport substrate-binding protein|uniref:substrate-binding periplasmic protein n=1 Tax=Pseudomonas sp. GV071 TaxID=2135754 RepID=UPI000D3B7AED|nr:ABC transporter substrate-binding protein [Pseudomonas sp. GV071]PTQ72317.1 amino acid ABC transporter substrate-binding protein (PAAT family) [Pseudomonas sp. GV071]